MWGDLSFYHCANKFQSFTDFIINAESCFMKLVTSLISHILQVSLAQKTWIPLLKWPDQADARFIASWWSGF